MHYGVNIEIIRQNVFRLARVVVIVITIAATIVIVELWLMVPVATFSYLNPLTFRDTL